MQPIAVVHPTQIRPDSVDVIDLLQARVLAGMFSNKVKNMVVKGGMAMRLAHNHARHTKDIDLDAEHDATLDSIQRLVRSSIKQATQGGWLDNVSITEPKQTHTTARWKINGNDPRTNQHLHLTVEISFRQHLQEDDIHHVETEDCGVKMIVPVYKDEMLAINKIDALLSDHRDAPRDVIDLFLLFQAGVEIPTPKLSERLGECDIEEKISTLWNKIESMDEKRFQEEIVPIWDMDSIPVEWQDWLKIRLYVEEQVEQCLLRVREHRSSRSHH